MKKLAALIATAVVALVAASPAQAHFGRIAADCNAVTFTFTAFPATPTPVSFRITSTSGATLNGSLTVVRAGTFQVPFVTQGQATVNAFASWSADTGGHAFASVPLSCPLPPPPPPAPVPVPVAAPPAPAPAPVAAPAPRPRRVKPKAKNCRHGAKRVRRHGRVVRVCRRHAQRPRFTG